MKRFLAGIEDRTPGLRRNVEKFEWPEDSVTTAVETPMAVVPLPG